MPDRESVHNNSKAESCAIRSAIASRKQVIVRLVDRDWCGRVVREVFSKHPQPSQSGEKRWLNVEQVQARRAYVG
ncbi:hypothetical protein [Stenomitos frigidus]|uniref:hypothetical protein n=1 Tax=Stenomitos frigidus TaxID=1886765 RepID=UPI0011B22863|nr:hypothetical protein [Stenomitos frigidus]